MTDDKSNLLIIVIDTNPVWWGQRLVKQEDKVVYSIIAHATSEGFVMSQCLDAIMVFANAHLMLSSLNKLAVIAAHSDHSEFLYPQSQGAGSDVSPNGDVTNGEERGGKYELLSEVDGTIKQRIKDLILSSTPGSQLYPDSLIAGALSMALCYIHRMEKEKSSGISLTSRILVVKASEDNPLQYMNFMNIVFTGQKQNVLIDACVIDNESSLLQQACDITGGIYLKIPQLAGLLQYLMWVFLPDPDTRCKLNLPTSAQVDYRAACFCHRNLIDIGFVCSVCLSIFCTYTPFCSTCHTTFKMLEAPKLIKKKLKKSTK